MPTLVLTNAHTFGPTSISSTHKTQCVSPVRPAPKVGCRYNKQCISLLQKGYSHNRQCINSLKVGFMSCKDTFSFGEFRKRARCAKGKGKVAASSESGGGATLDKWIKMLPDKKEPLYSHSLPCIEAWLTSLGFVQSKEDRAVWRIEKPDWRAQLSLDITDLYIRYQNNGPGNIDRVERKFSYALSREDLENAILGGP
ncbi:uncharacterized protein LOC131062330 isoform X2 [Cryptomeria japonica]|uniref:uncharacterized protein LOC131062330 isoform X2 n=1 Tax=Cryptomeria japonica TaxID=3369 RepID=UPI0025AC5955|nr:uncharacterized protein LOC131062330 isoform X2 [Cryptomeria japonica]